MDYKVLITRIISSILLMFVFIFSFLQSIYLIALFILILYIMIIFEIKLFFKYKNLLTYLYIISSLLIVEMYLLFFLNINFVISFILIIILFDTYSYLFGTFLGKNKIFPLISPNKSYEGLIFGYLFLGEQITYKIIVALVAVMISTYLIERGKSAKIAKSAS